MKKIIIMIIMFVGMCMVSKANEVKIIDRIKTIDTSLCLKNETKEKDYNFFVEHEQLGNYIGLSTKDSIKMVNVYNVYDAFCDAMNRAGNISTDKKRKKLIFNSFDYVLRNMRMHLDDFQYHMFLRGLNVTLHNKGFDDESWEYCEKIQ